MSGADQPLAAVDAGEQVNWEGETVEEPVFLAVLAEVLELLRAEEVPHVVLGGVASTALGRPRWTHDLDVFVRPDDAERALEALGRAGYATQRANEFWLYKAVKRGVLVDLVFKSHGDVYLDEEMLARAVTRKFKGIQVPVLAPEDLVVLKAILHKEERPHHWYDALGIMATCELDWDYLVGRASHGARRVLSLLVFAQSNDLLVPDEAVQTLFERIYRRDH